MQPLDESRKHLDSAVNWQRIALTPHPSRGNIAEGVSGGSCVAIADYFPEISSVGIEAMDALLDPTFVCDKNVKDTLRPKTSRWRGTWQQMNYAWDQYDTLYYENCKDEPGAKQVLQQSYLPLKKKFQEATDAYQDVDAYCAQKA
ncbi:hypothetical protein N7450_003027 [Penicillium hetheringtonii]|uniref:Uncharacterized protein n=1 Tax=Penicillium hetheringtonii TaxID=911720 RepID=A0AAD6DYJ3_9EURO|nr:hypothetical protein N7450_003027 [Penicillium hetheringtonii]